MSAGGWIQTWSGRRFWPMAPRQEDVWLPDIAHALSLMCRFTGHTTYHLSVAEHSVRVARLVQSSGGLRHEILWGLLHDASEAYLVDLPRPLKHLPEFRPYREAERLVMHVIAEALGLEGSQPDIVDHADKVLLATEARDLMPNREVAEWSWMPPPLPAEIVPWSPRAAEIKFLDTYELFKPRKGG